jgi:1-acyl-sn-glycerol-3-phosphate acyltransferase
MCAHPTKLGIDTSFFNPHPALASSPFAHGLKIRATKLATSLCDVRGWVVWSGWRRSAMLPLPRFRVSDWFYNVVWYSFWPAFGASSSPVVLHPERPRRPGAYLLAANHLSPFDVPCLIKESGRKLDFVSITEVFQNRFMAWFYGNMNAFPLDRGRHDVGATRTILDRLAKGRAVGIFPEGGIRTEANSVLNGGRIKPGVIRLAKLSKVPIIPAVVLGSAAYFRPMNWAPLRRVRYGINFGEPIEPGEGESMDALQEQLLAAYRALHAELLSAMAHLPKPGATA